MAKIISIHEIIAGTYIPVGSHPNDLPFHRIIRQYNTINNKDKKALVDDLINSYISITIIQDNAETIYYLLQAIIYIHPIELYGKLRMQLYNGTLEDIYYSDLRLDIVLLKACTQYNIDDMLSEHIEARFISTNNISEKMLYFRLICSNSPHNALSMLNDCDFKKDIESHDEEIVVRFIKDELFTFVERYKYGTLYKWYIKHLENEVISNSIIKKAIIEMYSNDNSVNEILESKQPYESLMLTKIFLENNNFNSDVYLKMLALAGRIEYDTIMKECINICKTKKVRMFNPPEKIAAFKAPNHSFFVTEDELTTVGKTYSLSDDTIGLQRTIENKCLRELT